MPPASPHLQQATKIQVIAVPATPRQQNIKLISINQYETLSTNGYKEFDMSIAPKLSTNSSDNGQCIQDIQMNVINLNFVTELSLRGCGLQYLPKELSILPLRELDLMNNIFTHVPECLYAGLHNVEVLNLAHNLIKDFNITPKCAAHLKVLHVEECQLKTVPMWIQEMKSYCLEELYFSKNVQHLDLERRDCPQLHVKVKKLVFNNTGVRQKMIRFFKSFNLLEYLDISNVESKRLNVLNDINDLVCKVPWARHIKVLKMNNLNVSELSDDFCKLRNLRELHCNQNLLLNIPIAVINLKDLVVLDVSFNCIYTLPELSGLQMLEELHAAKNHLTTISLRNMPRLKYLDLYDNELETVDVTFAPEWIDIEQNNIDVDVLLNNLVDNYEERRESLRRRRCQIADALSFEWRAIGRKLSAMELDSPSDDAGDRRDVASDCYSDGRYSDNGDEGLGGCGSQGETYKIEAFEAAENSADEWSDWGESSANTLVTLSDAEFLPEEDASPPSPSPAGEYKANTSLMDSIQFEHLFIDAD